MLQILEDCRQTVIAVHRLMSLALGLEGGPSDLQTFRFRNAYLGDAVAAPVVDRNNMPASAPDVCAKPPKCATRHTRFGILPRRSEVISTASSTYSREHHLRGSCASVRAGAGWEQVRRRG